MRRTNRVEPASTGSDAGDLAGATVTTTTRMEFVRRTQVVPMREALAQLHCDLNQSLAGDVIISPRIWTGMHSVATPMAASSGSLKTVCFIGIIFIGVALVALSATIIGLAIAFGNTSSVGTSSIERYDIGDLNFGMSGTSVNQYASNSYLSSGNKAIVEKYFSDQLSTEPGYRGLLIDGVLVQQNASSGRRRRRTTSCPITFIIQNIQVYFDACSTCISSRNTALRRSLSNLTAFQTPLSLAATSGNGSQVSLDVCSTPNITALYVPVVLSILEAQQINSSLIAVTTSTVTTVATSTASTVTTVATSTASTVTTVATSTTSAATYAVSTSIAGLTTRSPDLVTSQNILTERLSTLQASSVNPIETSLPLTTTIMNDIGTSIPTTISPTTTDSTSKMESTSGQLSTIISEISTVFKDSTSTVSIPIDQTSFMHLTTIPGTIQDATTAKQISDTTISVGLTEHTTLTGQTAYTTGTGSVEHTTSAGQTDNTASVHDSDHTTISQIIGDTTLLTSDTMPTESIHETLITQGVVAITSSTNQPTISGQHTGMSTSIHSESTMSLVAETVTSQVFEATSHPMELTSSLNTGTMASAS
ncbi:unnamed protein product, partial [Rotaria magnacalcarata]